MFGYITYNKPEMKFKEYDIYHSYYCGLCKTLKDNYGYLGQISLNNDLTFIAILLSSLYEEKPIETTSRCIMHPNHKYTKYSNKYIDYCAKMTIVLTYFKCEDDWVDEKKISKELYLKSINKSFNKIKKEYNDKVSKIQQYLNKIRDLEKDNCNNLDEISRYSGLMMANIVTYTNDIWYDDLYELGFYLGKFIYFMDAYDDIDNDIKKNCYNPFIHIYKEVDFDDKVYNILELMMSKCATAFECLPIIENIEILRNIIYSGVWSHYELINKKRVENK